MEDEVSPDRQTDPSLPSESPRANAGISAANPKLWTMQEDERLKAAVREYGSERIDWKEVQQKFRLRAAKSCRLRWENQLKPDIDHSAFDPEEDALILKMQQNEGNKWSLIAQTLTDNKRQRSLGEAALDGALKNPFRRTDNQVKNRWHSALERVMKSGRPGHGFTDLEFEAEALRRVESEQRLLVTPQGEELRLAANSNGCWEVRLGPNECSQLRPHRRRVLDSDWHDDDYRSRRRRRQSHRSRGGAINDCFQDTLEGDFTEYMDSSLDGQFPRKKRGGSYSQPERPLAIPTLGHPFSQLPDVFACNALHSVELPLEAADTPAVPAQCQSLSPLGLLHGPRLDHSGIACDGHLHLFGEGGGGHGDHDFDFGQTNWALDGPDLQPPSLHALTSLELDREHQIQEPLAQSTHAALKHLQPSPQQGPKHQETLLVDRGVAKAVTSEP